MRGFEFLQNITVGQYLPTGSILHRLHPVSKLIILFLLITAAVICSSLTGLLLGLAAALAGLALARVPLRYAFKGLRPALPFLIFLALLQIVAIPGNDVGNVLGRWWIITITTKDFLAAAVTMIRFVALILLISLFTFTASTRELTHGTEYLFKPLQKIGFPAHEFALIITLAMRFIPLLALEAERIVRAQASRGADFGRGRMSLIRRVRRMMPVLIPFFLAALRRSETMVLAMEARCYTGGKDRTKLIQFKAHMSDPIAVAIVCILCAGILAAGRMGLDMRLWHLIGG